MRRTLYAAGSAVSGPTKLLADDGTTRLITIVVLTAGKTVYLAHSACEILENNRGVQGGYQLKDTSSPTDGRIPWKGDLWAVGSTDNVEIDLEAIPQR